MNPRVMDSRWEYIHILSKEAKRSVGTREFRGGVPNIFSLQSRRGKAWSDVHKATFPVELPSWGIETFTNPGDIVLEPFCGTGTTMIAAHLLGRTCYAMEIDPRYAAVTIERMSEAGLAPRRADRHESQG